MNVKGGGMVFRGKDILQSSMKRLTIKINQSKFIRQLHCERKELKDSYEFLLETQVCTIKSPKLAMKNQISQKRSKKL